ncbi:MAG: hypothetical protein EXR75_04210 [Myxococcales bacterium]|nr:hypothetical protein [Myxococcales bacterium]
MNTHRNEDTLKTATFSSPATLIERLMEDGALFGRVWATYGIELGRHALTTTAKSFEITASVLGRVAAELGNAAQHTKPAAPSERASAAPANIVE